MYWMQKNVNVTTDITLPENEISSKTFTKLLKLKSSSCTSQFSFHDCTRKRSKICFFSFSFSFIVMFTTKSAINRIFCSSFTSPFMAINNENCFFSLSCLLVHSLTVSFAFIFNFLLTDYLAQLVPTQYDFIQIYWIMTMI